MYDFKSIMNSLGIGKENAKKLADLAKERGNSIREQTKEIHDARKAGFVILSNTDSEKGGYYLPKNIEEVKEYLAFKNKCIDSTKEALKSIEEFYQCYGFKN